MGRIENKHLAISKIDFKTAFKRMCILAWLVLIIIGLLIVK
ncbi:hypothetical protein GCM10022297_03490 [Lactobacillus hamsteri]|nr:hypothetical protein [Lactobacillus hamsteri]